MSVQLVENLKRRWHVSQKSKRGGGWTLEGGGTVFVSDNERGSVANLARLEHDELIKLPAIWAVNDCWV
jgi:hypothetical protein